MIAHLIVLQDFLWANYIDIDSNDNLPFNIKTDLMYFLNHFCILH